MLPYSGTVYPIIRDDAHVMSKIPNSQLAALSARLATALESGIEERTVWRREADRARGRSIFPLARIASTLERGGSLAEAVKENNEFFPPLFLQLIEIGEETGKLPTVLRRLAAHYDHRVRMRRTFLAGITWPAIQFFAAIFIVGFLIWILGAIAATRGPAAYDILGLGLIGNQGLTIYIIFWAVLFALGFGLFLFLRSGSRRFIETSLLKVPGVGACLKTISLTRFCWSLSLLLEAGMDVRRSVPLAFGATGNQYYTAHQSTVSALLSSGEELYVALLSTGIFPDDFLDALQVGEQSGRLDESLKRLADLYQERARGALATLTKLASFSVWAFVALMIIGILVNMVAGYASFLQGLSRPG